MASRYRDSITGIAMDASQAGQLHGPQRVFDRQVLGDDLPGLPGRPAAGALGAMLSLLWSRRLRRRLRQAAASTS
jgi:hypothetical protein